MPRIGRPVVPLAIALLGLGCQVPRYEARTRIPPKNAGVCEEIAYVFYLVAEGRDRGVSHDEQVKAVTTGVNNPFSKRPEETRSQLLRVVDYVYDADEASAEEIEARVLDHCVVDARGKALVRLGPSEAPATPEPAFVKNP